MPKKSYRKQQDVFGQIFDFLFAQAEKKPEKRKPVRVTGLNGKGMLVDGIASALEAPGVFLTTQTAKDFNDALDITLVKIKPDQNVPSASIKISTGNLIDIIKDPVGVFKKASDRAKEARLSSRATYMGYNMRELIANGWARKYADLDTQEAVRYGLASQSMSKRAKNALLESDTWNMQAAVAAASRGASGTPDGATYSYMQNRAGILLGRRIFSERRWNSFSDEDREDLNRIFAGVSLDQESALKEKIRSMGLGAEEASILRNYKSTPHSLGDPTTYRSLEIGNLKSRISDLQQQALRTGMTPDINNKIFSFQKAELLIGGQDLSAQNVKGVSQQMAMWMGKLKTEIRNESDKGRREMLKKQLQELHGDYRQFNSQRFWGAIGSIEGYVSSFQNLVGGGNYIASILNGDLYDPNRTTALRPSDTKKFEDGVEIFVPRKGHALFNQYNEALTDLYYLTPRSFVRTLFFNGEGFAYNFYKNSEFLKNSFNLVVDEKDFEKLLSKNSEAFINNLITQGIQGGKFSAASAKIIEKRLKLLARQRRLYKFFSINSRLKEVISKNINKFMKKRREVLVANLMKSNLFKKMFSGAAGNVLGQWVANGGIQNLARMIVVGIANALGIATTGGAANFIIAVVSSFVADALTSVAQVLFGLVVFALIGLVGIFVVMFIGMGRYQKQAYTYANTVPGEVYVNPDYSGTSPIIGEDDNLHNLGTFVGGNLPDGEKCLLGSSSTYTCTQGPYGSYSHQNVAAVDITGSDYFYAPAFCGNSNCVVTYSGSAYCSDGYAGGEVKFTAVYGGASYEFTLIHVSTTYGVGTQLSAGQAVARVMTLQETTSSCSSGKHIHVQTKVNGSVVNPWNVLNNATTLGGFGCHVGACPTD